MIFKPEEREIFVYFNGTREVKADPLPLSRKLDVEIQKSGRDIQALVDIARQPEVSPDLALEANATILGIVRETFGVKALGDDDGLTETETYGLLGSFVEYVAGLKKKRESLQSGSTSGDSLQDEPSTTKSMSDSGLTEGGSGSCKRSRRSKQRQ